MSQSQVGRGPDKFITAESKAFYNQPSINDAPASLVRRALSFVRPFICTGLLSAVTLVGLSDSVAQDPPLSMSRVRDGASASLLSDGQVLIAGGAGPDGIVATAELFGDTATFTAAASMNVPRTEYASVVLLDGRVLVTGGLTTNYEPTASAEVYDSATDTWTLLPDMGAARYGHTASILSTEYDGLVIIAGGDSTGSAPSTIEIFDPVANAFTTIATLSSARQYHSAAVLDDNRVLLSGGKAGDTVLSTIEIFDPATGTVTVGPTMLSPRTHGSATTLLDGVVLIAGGYDGETDLASAEIFDPYDNTIATVPSSLATPRSSHLALRLPKNNNVLFLGGSSNGIALDTCELFIPWMDEFRPWSPLIDARIQATGAPLSVAGLMLVAGGQGQTSAEVYGFPTLTTGKDDYPPFAYVDIYGTGFGPNELVTNEIYEVEGLNAGTVHDTWDTTATDTGTFETAWLIFSEEFLGSELELTATGNDTGITARTRFTDAAEADVFISPSVINPSPISPGQQFTAIVQNRTDSTVAMGSFVVTPPAGYTITGIVSVSNNQGKVWSAIISNNTIRASASNAANRISNGQTPPGQVSIVFTATTPPSAPVSGNWDFDVWVNAGFGGSAFEVHTNPVTTLNQLPVVQVSGPVTVDCGEISLSGTASDPDGDSLTYNWTSNDPSVSVNNDNSINASAVLSGDVPPCNKSATLTLTVTDEHGLSASASTLATFNDDVSPVAPAAPAAASFQCAAEVPAPGELTATDNCSPDITVTGVDSNNGGSGCEADPLVITRTWTFADECGNSSSVSQEITVADTTDPVAPAAPAAASFQCTAEVPAPGELTATDNCSPDITVTGVDSNNGGSGCEADPLVITRTWTFADECGNSSSVSQEITVADTTDPVAPAAPAAASFQCTAEVPAPGELTATDNCSPDITVAGVDSNNGGSGCEADPLVITRTWTFADECGNSSSVSQEITVADTTDPVAPAAPAAASFQCTAEVPAPGELTATDNCSPDITVTGVDSNNGGSGCEADPLVITRTWTFADECGNSSSVSQEITVADTTDPVAPAAPAAASFQCTAEVPAPGELTATDNCSPDITVTGVDSNNGGSGCEADPLVITRTWTFADECGNSSSVSQEITVADTTDPVAPAAPAAASFQCAAEVPAPGELTATDNCSPDITVTGVDSNNGGSGCEADPLVITRTWTFADECGNSSSVSQEITVADTTDPVAPAAPAAASFQCTAEVPAPGELTATDNCSPDITVTGVDSNNGGSGCEADPLVITRTWTFADECGNSSSVSQEITVADTTDPVAPAAPAAASFQCAAEVPAPGELTATDNCSPDITVTGVDSNNGGSGCEADPLVITRTWTFADECGNSSSVSQEITVADTTDPVAPAAPAAASFQCTAEVPAPGELTATDNCSPDITVTGVDSNNGGSGCEADPLVITRTWTFADECGNSSSVSQEITVADTTDPVAPAAPAAASFQCAAEVPAPGELTATDNCSPDITVTGVDSNNGGSGCEADPLVITRTWTFADECGNSSSVSQEITVADTTDPVAPAAPAAASFQCAAEVPAPGELTATDNCSPDITVTGVDSNNGGSGCEADPLVITRTWTFADECGNSSSVSQEITVADTTDPVAPAAPAAASFQCTAEVPAPGELTATDNCSPDITVTGVDSNNGGSGCEADPLVITRTWTFADECGNSSSVSQEITVADTTDPVAPAAPAAASFQCAAEVPAPGELTATDNCSPDITVTGVDSNNGGSGCEADPLVITRTWTFADECGNSSSVSQEITVADTTDPVAPAAPAAASFQCTAEVPAPGELTATDNCSPDITVTGVDSNNGGSGCEADPLVITRTWTFADECGNSSSVSQEITVADTTDPVAPAAPAAASFQCTAEVPAPGELTATDNCSPDITVTGVDSNNGGSGCEADPLVITRTWTFADECGNSSSVSQEITVADTQAPAIATPADSLDETLECSDSVGLIAALAAVPTATDNCTGQLTAELISDNTVYAGTWTTEYVRTRTWQFTDSCGNTSAQFVQTITVQDTLAPSFTCPENKSALVGPNCQAAVPDFTGDVIATDSCSTAQALIATQDPAAGDLVSAAIHTVTITVTDEAGNSSSCQVTFAAQYHFDGFLPPVGGAVELGNGGSYDDPIRAFKKGSTIPFKFRLSCSGNPVAVGNHSLSIAKYSSATTSEPAVDVTPTDAATTGNFFRLTSGSNGEWHYNLNTKNMTKGRYLATATLSDGSTYTVWFEVK